MKTTDRLINQLADIETETICLYCNGARPHGCVNADDKPVPCLCDGSCDHDQECICECHKWADTIRETRKQLRRLSDTVDQLTGSLEDANHFRDHWFNRYIDRTSA